MLALFPTTFLILLDCLLISTTPAPVDINRASMPGALLRGHVQTINPTPQLPASLTQTSSATTSSTFSLSQASSLPNPSASASSDGPSTYAVTGPETKTHIYPFRSIPLNTQAFMPLLNLSKARIDLHMQNGGADFAKYWLTQEDDPFVYQEGANTTTTTFRALLYAESNVNETGTQQHLTYEMLSNVVQGLSNWVEQGQQSFGCRFEVEQAPWGMLGRGMVLPGGLPAIEMGNSSGSGEGWLRRYDMMAVVKALGEDGSNE